MATVRCGFPRSTALLQALCYRQPTRLTPSLVRAFSSSSQPADRQGPSSRYYRLAAEQQVRLDDAQIEALAPLERLHRELETYVPLAVDAYDQHVRHRCRQAQQNRVRDVVESHARQQQELYAFVDPKKAETLVTTPDVDHRLLEADLESEAKALPSLDIQPRGVYLWGSVGCGKSMLMDLFFEGAPVQGRRKLRIHFHSFMRDVLQQLHRLNTHCSPSLKRRYDNNLVQLVAKNVAQQIPDVGTAGILYRLFKHLNEYGVVVVATSNRAPNELYQGHFRETLFDPFVRVLEDRMEVACMHSNTDYRVLMANHLDGPGNLFGDPCYIGEGADELLDDAWTIATQGQRIRPSSVHVFGRNVSVPESTDDGIARFDFKQLCAAALGPADYLALARTFHTIFIRGIPRLTMAGRNEARRLISLVDALYECRTKVHCSLALRPEMLFLDVGDAEHDRFEIMHGEMLGQMLYDLGADTSDVYKHALFTGDEEVFASKRCVSRLYEMRSAAYWALPHDGGAGAAGIDAAMLQLEEEDEDQSEVLAMRDPLHDTRDKPRFTARHFWGGGWWEKVRERQRQGDKSESRGRSKSGGAGGGQSS